MATLTSFFCQLPKGRIEEDALRTYFPPSLLNATTSFLLAMGIRWEVLVLWTTGKPWAYFVNPKQVFFSPFSRALTFFSLQWESGSWFPIDYSLECNIFLFRWGCLEQRAGKNQIPTAYRNSLFVAVKFKIIFEPKFISQLFMEFSKVYIQKFQVTL